MPEGAVFNTIRTYAVSALLCCFARLLPQCIGHTFWSQASLAPRIASDCVGPSKDYETIRLYSGYSW